MNENIRVTYVGLDVHKAFIQVAVLVDETSPIVELRKPNTPSNVAWLVRRLRKISAPQVELCYEAGPTGYGLSRKLNEQEGFHCQVIAPSLIPKKPGDRVKTDKRDAKKLVMYLKSGLLTEVHPPTPEDEARRELCRARGTAKDDERRAKQRLSKFLLRQGRVYRGGKSAWTCRHMCWLEQQKFDYPHLQTAFDSHLRALEQAGSRVRELDKAVELAAKDETVREPVALLQCFKGVKIVSAMCLVTELYDIERFPSATKLMSFLGLTASEHSSGGSSNRGGITKAGNSRVRRLLVESVRNVIRTNKTGYQVKKRREGQPGWAVDLAERAQQRLFKRYWRLVSNGKAPNKAIVAVSREFAGFIWAMLHQLAHAKHAEVAA